MKAINVTIAIIVTITRNVMKAITVTIAIIATIRRNVMKAINVTITMIGYQQYFRHRSNLYLGFLIINCRRLLV